MFKARQPAYLLPIVVALGALFNAPAATAEIIPAARRTTWNPGLNAVGGIPYRTTIYRTINPSGGDDTSAIQSALNSCPADQVVKLGPGTFRISGQGLTIRRSNITLRGSGSSTRLVKTLGTNYPVIIIGLRWPGMTQATNLAANAVKGSRTVTLASNPGLEVGEIVYIDQLTNDSLTWWSPRSPVGDPSRGWFGRMNRPLAQVMEVESVSGTAVTFTTPFHIDFSTSFGAQLVRMAQNSGGPMVPMTKWSGIEDLYVYGGEGGDGGGNIHLFSTAYSWVKNVESDYSNGTGINLDGTFRCEVRDSYIHSVANPNPGGGGYLLGVNSGAADNLIENNIVWNGNKVIVMRVSGGGNVVGYNYMEDAYGQGYKSIVEVGLNAAHMTTPHMELFEGNQSFNFDSDSVWGNSIYITAFRNHLTARRRSLSGLNLTDSGNRRAAGLTINHWWYNFVGNILGMQGQTLLPGQSSFVYETSNFNTSAVPMWKIGYNGENGSAPQDQTVLARTIRHGNFDYVTNSVRWDPANPDQNLPPSLYLTKKPAFFGNHPWPWVDPTGTTKLHTLPARERFDAGTPMDVDLIFADDFQSADLSSWSIENTDAGDLHASNLAGLASTTQGLRAVVDDVASLFVQDDWPRDEDRFRARFYFDPNGFDPGTVLGHLRTRIFIAFEENPTRRLAAIVLRRQGVQFSVMARCRLDDDSQADTAFVPITDAPHYLEIHWRKSSSPTANDGVCQLFVDGQSVGNLTNLDNNLSSVDFVRLGALSVKAGAMGVMFWDEYWSRRNSYIGP